MKSQVFRHATALKTEATQATICIPRQACSIFKLSFCAAMATPPAATTCQQKHTHTVETCRQSLRQLSVNSLVRNSGSASANWRTCERLIGLLIIKPTWSRLTAGCGSSDVTGVQ